jgi:hypothetical protein
MRTLLFIAALCIAAPALAQTPPEPPAQAPPAATAPIEQREDWCQTYAAWFVASMPAEGETPADVRETQRIETELNSCKLDPPEYRRQTTAELEQAAEIEAG